jgi:LPXTG-motif cell wall-anchored protein
MSTVAIVLIVLGALLLLALLGGYLATRRREELQSGDFDRHVREADQALEVARSADKGWDRAVMERAARSAAQEAHPDASFDELHLVLVDDRPGVEEDRAHFVAVGPAAQARVVLTRRGETWVAERVE